jgi:hypothetical protein
LDDFQRVQRVDLVDVLFQLVSGFGLDFLYLLKSALLDEGLLGGRVVGESLGELVQHVVQDLGGTVFDQGLEGAQVGTHLQDTLQGLLCLLFQVLRATWLTVEIKEQSGDVLFGEGFGVIRGVSSHLSQTPSSGSSYTLVLVLESIAERIDALGLNDSHG